MNIPFILFSQDYNQNKKAYRSNYLSTDFLSLLNSFISSERTIYLTGEMCVDHSIGFRINIFHIRDHSTGYIRNAIGAGPEIRLYMMDEDCSAFHLGAYLNFEEGRITKREILTSKVLMDYNESILETGLSGGYKIVFKNHWVLNPAAYAGISNRYNKQILTETDNSFYYTESDLMLRVALEVGYKF